MTPQETARQAAAIQWKMPVAQVYEQEISSNFPWCRKHRVFLVLNQNRAALVVVVEDEGQAMVFSGTDVLTKLNRLIQEEGIHLPGALSPMQIAEMTRRFLAGTGGFVGSSAFWHEQQDALSMWTSPSPKEGPKLFRDYCRDPIMKQENGTWRLNFYYFNNRGGVDEWNIAGDTSQIKSAQPHQVVPQGTFLFPYG